MKIGVLGAADIAERRFLPALSKISGSQLAAVGVSSDKRLDNAVKLTEKFGGTAVVGYDNVIENKDIDAVYIPLPPSLHYEWAKKALLAGKHVFVEKPSTTKAEHTKELVKIAGANKLAIVENYGFVRHPQAQLIHSLINEGAIGEIRNIRSAFGFPKRPDNDIRHKKALGGGSLLDAGGYTIKAGFDFLRDTARVTTSALSYLDDFDVDMYGTLTMENGEGKTLQASFGMDCFYKCELEIWGQSGMIKAPRFYTAPDGFTAKVTVSTRDGDKVYDAEPADQFMLQTEYFMDCCSNDALREEAYRELEWQTERIESAFEIAK